MDWAPGDLALCVKVSAPCPDCGDVWPFQTGSVHTVAQVDRYPGYHYAVLLFTERNGPTTVCIDGEEHVGFPAIYFRKISAHEADAFDREVIAALNSEPVHARNNDAVHNTCQCEVSNFPLRDGLKPGVTSNG